MRALPISITPSLSLLPCETKSSEPADIISSKLKDLRSAEQNQWTSIAYAIVVAIENDCRKNNGKANKKYFISENVIGEIHKLTAGQHPTAGRKPGIDSMELSQSDLLWVKKAAERIGHRIHEIETSLEVKEYEEINLGTIPRK